MPDWLEVALIKGKARRSEFCGGLFVLVDFLQSFLFLNPLIHFWWNVGEELVKQFCRTVAGEDHFSVVVDEEPLIDHAVHVVGEAGIIAFDVEQAVGGGVVAELVPGQMFEG